MKKLIFALVILVLVGGVVWGQDLTEYGSYQKWDKGTQFAFCYGTLQGWLLGAHTDPAVSEWWISVKAFIGSPKWFENLQNGINIMTKEKPSSLTEPLAFIVVMGCMRTILILKESGQINTP